eukprot:4574486-Alexandrium_andersonii.AAC.1
MLSAPPTGHRNSKPADTWNTLLEARGRQSRRLAATSPTSSSWPRLSVPTRLPAWEWTSRLA